MENKMRIRPLDSSYIGLFVALLTVCSWISIPMTVPVTLQTFAVFVCIALLGTKRALCVIGVYLLLGAVGVPVYANFGAGIGYLSGSTGGYMLGFFAASLVTGGMIGIFGKKRGFLFFAMLAGLLTCYLFGTLWFYYVYLRGTSDMNITAVLSVCVFPYVIPDLLKIWLAVLADSRLARFIK